MSEQERDLPAGTDDEAAGAEPDPDEGAHDQDDDTPPEDEGQPKTGRRFRRRRGRPAKARGQPNSSDAASARWTVRGVPPHIRDIALRAAEGRNMTVGDWVAEAIIAYARGKTAERPPETTTNVPATESPPDLVSLIERLDDRMTRIEEWQNRGFFARIFRRPRAAT